MRSNFREGTVGCGRGGPGFATSEGDQRDRSPIDPRNSSRSRSGKWRNCGGSGEAASEKTQSRSSRTVSWKSGNRARASSDHRQTVGRASRTTSGPHLFHVKAALSWLSPFWASASRCWASSYSTPPAMASAYATSCHRRIRPSASRHMAEHARRIER